MRIDLTSTVARPEQWAELAAAVPDYTVSIPWLDTMAPLLPGEPRWLVASIDGSARIGLHTRWLHTQPDEPRHDIAAALRGELPSPEPQQSPTAVPDTGPLYPSILATLPGYSCAPAGSGAHDPALLRDTLHAVDAWAGEQGARSVSFLYIPDRHEPLRRALTEFGAIPVRLYPTCVLPLTFDSVEGYLDQLPRARRHDIQRLLRRLDDNGMTVEEADPAEIREEILELRLGLLRKYDADADRVAQAATLDRMLEHYRPRDIVVTAARRENRVVGFSLGLRHGDTLRQLWCGQLPDADGAYFVMLYYESVAAALRRGIERIDYGTLKWKLKASYGCRLEQLTGSMWTVTSRAW